MVEYNEVVGDLISLAKKGNFDVIAHGCNCMSNMGAGIAVPMNLHFDVSQFRMELMGPSIEKLGNIEYKTFVLGENRIWCLEDGKNNLDEPELIVVNAYTQNYPSIKLKPLDYEALTLCMRKMNVVFKGKHIGLPKIGAGLAGGDWNRIQEIIKTELKDCKVTIVMYQQKNK